MNINKLPTDYVDSVADVYKYKLTEKSANVYEVADKTEYTEVGSFWTAEDINTSNSVVNAINEEETATQKRIADITSGALQDSMIEAEETIDAPTFQKFKELIMLNETPFDGSESVTVEDTDKVSNNDSFILAKNKSLSFSSGVCKITDARIKVDSLANVMFSKDSISEAYRCVVTVDTYDGYLEISAKRTPNVTLVASILIRS